jgi:hypothetical protein
MTSKIAIANRALTKLGAARITSLEDDQKEAREVSSMFDIVRDAELRARAWSFSMKRVQLAAEVDTPVFGYSFQYPLPSDCLRIWMVGDYFFSGPELADYNNGNTAPYTVEGRKILTNRSDSSGVSPGPLRLRYLAAIDDTNQWDACFVEAFACRLAAELAEPLTQSTTRRQLAWEEYDQAIQAGRRANAIELPPEYMADDSWVMGRFR